MALFTPGGVPKCNYDRYGKGNPGHDIADTIGEQSSGKTAGAD